MPELPEVECLARQMRRRLTGARVTAVSLLRRDVLRAAPASRVDAALLAGAVIAGIHRHGKQLAIESEDGRTLVVRLGMSGALRMHGGEHTGAATSRPPHTHVAWSLELPRGARTFELLFVDPRRFGGLAAFDALESARRTCWAPLGPDALTVTASLLRNELGRSRRPVKSLLLDQGVLAGVGNIYADEALHRAGIHPLTPAASCVDVAETLASLIRDTLRQAIRLGGSTIRDYADTGGAPGRYQEHHRVYGRGGEPCPTCLERGSRERPDRRRAPRCSRASTGTISTVVLGGRTTVFCPVCQPPPGTYPQFMHRPASGADRSRRSHARR